MLACWQDILVFGCCASIICIRGMRKESNDSNLLGVNGAKKLGPTPLGIHSYTVVPASRYFICPWDLRYFHSLGVESK